MNDDCFPLKVGRVVFDSVSPSITISPSLISTAQKLYEPLKSLPEEETSGKWRDLDEVHRKEITNLNKAILRKNLSIKNLKAKLRELEYILESLRK